MSQTEQVIAAQSNKTIFQSQYDSAVYDIAHLNDFLPARQTNENKEIMMIPKQTSLIIHRVLYQGLSFTSVYALYVCHLLSIITHLTLIFLCSLPSRIITKVKNTLFSSIMKW